MGKGLNNQRIEVQTGVKNTRRRRGTFTAQGGQTRTPGNITVNTAAGSITGSGPVVRRTVTTQKINPITGRPSTITGGATVTPTGAKQGRQFKGSGNTKPKPNPTKKRKKK